MPRQRPATGRGFKTSFTIRAGRRYLWAMLLLALLAASAAPSEPVVRPEREARAMVRITRPASLRVGHDRTLEGVPLRDSKILESNGKYVPAKLAEFH